ncbi:BMP family ABC transporter substrate-binding protein [Pseudothermotoga thermarum]|uniref:Nucleoside-binding protein n=1 Tax=Pseudothermotoga thermarum DSM 5069 TaxID=688269 RepID=F7YTR0_9THEM|nr:BMP family ABC transporter substrate-binding protein [Pseudothermotoga thermarum]AEH51289.1 nucleoside-binding protein [Pseudothermotoga thermarum DSM 5069]
MKKLLVVLLLVLTLATFAKPLKVALLVNGNLGDKSFFDSAARGVYMARDMLGVQIRIVEAGYNPANWRPYLEDLSDQDFDIIIVGTWQMVEILEEIAPRYPKKRYIIFDTSVDYSKKGLNNVYSILYKQNEGSFLVGALAALITTSGMPKTNPEPIIGFLGGMDIPVINDFLVGYIEGARYINPNIKVLISYVGSFNDPAKGKELSLAMYRQGADIIFNVAGNTGIGLLEAAKEADRWAIGVDSDQALIYEDTDIEIAKRIVTSMMKNVDLSLFRAIKLHLEGRLIYGQAEALGILEGGVGVADNKYYREIVPEEFRNKIKEIEEKILKGEIKVSSAYGMSPDELNKLRMSVRP